MNEQTAATPAPLLDQPVTRDQAPAALEALRADRVNGRVSEDHYFKKSDYLRGVMDSAPEAPPPAPPRQVETFEELYRRDVDAQMSGASAEHYTNLPSIAEHGGQTEGTKAFDAGMTRVLARAGIPQSYAPQLLENAYRDLHELGEADPVALELKISSVKSELQNRWGADYQTRLDRVLDLVADAVEADPAIAHAFEKAPWLFATNLWSMESLDRVAEHRSRMLEGR